VPEKSFRKEKLKLLIATENLGKFSEFKNFFSDLALDLLSFKNFPHLPKVSEPYLSFSENARHKAVFVHKQTGLMTLADDSGLEVDALKGEPGVFSARFAGENASDEENNHKLLKLLEGLPFEKRTARFKCVLALAKAEQEIILVEGVAEGIILFEPKGDKGFGYDPVFYQSSLKKSFGEMEPEEKLSVSHRGDALRKIYPFIKELVPD